MIVDVDADSLVNKYGQEIEFYTPDLIDRRDIGEVARLTLELPDLGYEVFYVFGGDDVENYDFQYTRDRLNWTPAHDFFRLRGE